MLEVKILLIEFMDSDPVADCPLVVTARVAPLFEEALAPPEQENPNQPIPQALDQPSDNSGLTVLKPLFSRAVNIRQQGQSGSNGIATFTFELTAVFEHVAKDNPNASDVKTYLLIEVNCAGIRRELNLIEFPLEANEAFETLLPFDFAKAIVGHVTANSVRLWFQYHGTRQITQRFTCEISQAGTQIQSRNVNIDATKANTSVLDVTGLQSETHYTYTLRMQDPADISVQSGRVLAKGEFNTASQSDQLTFIFGSCHQPVVGNTFPMGEALGRWKALANRTDYDFLLLMGDQIYGDNIEDFFPTLNWRERYINRYNQFWQYQPMRRVLRRTPTYMILDDHEVENNFGTSVTIENRRARVQNALDVYEIFQDSHNPPRSDSEKYHYSFRRGPAAFFVMDLRSRRGKEPDSPILGNVQLRDLRAWANDPDTRAADIIFLVSPLPLAVAPIEEMKDIVEDSAEKATVLTGAAAGAAVGGAFFGPVGAVIGGVVGAAGSQIAYDQLEEWAEIKYEIAEQWDFEPNQKELAAVLDILFDLANDITNGRPGPRPRAVFELAGDMHIGAFHVIRSNRSGDGRDHRRNPLIYQAISSGISRPPASLWNTIKEKLEPDVDLDKDLSKAKLVTSGFTAGSIANPFILDSEGEGVFASEFINLLVERNFGRMAIERIGTGRRYRFYLTIEGQQSGVVQLFELDLDAQPIKPQSLLGQVLVTQGKLTLLRVHDVGTKFGPQADQIDVEVIVQLDTEPHRSFGFQLRRDANQATHRKMLDLLRDSFNHNRQVRIDYVRTGLRNGQITRVSDLV